MGASRTTLSAVSRDPEGPFHFETLTLGDLRPDEVLVEIDAVGVCHTDLSSHRGLLGTSRPAVLGHEGAGRIIEVGEAVRTLQVGDAVVLTALTCGGCPSCLTGQSAYCSSTYELNVLAGRRDGTSAYEGTDVRSHFFGQSSFSEYAVATERNAVKIDAELDPATAAPFACGVMTGAGTVFNSLEIEPGSSVVVFGAGAVGMAAIMAARVTGASEIIAVDVVDTRLDLAGDLGATAVVNASTTDVAEELRRLLPAGTNYSIEASGNPLALRPAIDCLGQRATCAVVGQAGFGVEGSFDWLSLVIKGASIRGVTLGDTVPKVFLPMLLALHQQGRLPVDRIVTHFALADLNDAVDAMSSGAVIKPVLKVR